MAYLRIQILVCTLVVSLTPAKGQPRVPFSISISAPETVAPVGSDIVLHISLKNESDHDITVAKTPGDAAQAEFFYAIDVRDAQGRLAPETEYGHRMKAGLRRGSRVSHTVASGETLEDLAVLTRLYDLSRPGKYTVYVSRAISEVLGSGKGIVRSNAIEIEVTDRQSGGTEQH